MESYLVSNDLLPSLFRYAADLTSDGSVVWLQVSKPDIAKYTVVYPHGEGVAIVKLRLACREAANGQVPVYEPEITAVSHHVGKVGAYIRDVPVKLVFVAEGAGDYGVNYRHLFLDQDGNQLVWTTSRRYQRGEYRIVKATVNAHTKLKTGSKSEQTRITYVKLEAV